MKSYQFNNSFWVWGSSRFPFKVLDMMFRVSATGMFVQSFVMCNEAKVKWGSVGVSFSSLITSVVLSTLCLLGSEASCLLSVKLVSIKEVSYPVLIVAPRIL